MDNTTEKIFGVLAAIIAVTIVAVLISQKSNTANVISAASSGFGGILGVAISPITGTTPPQLASPGPSNQGPATQASSGGGINLTPVITSAVPIITNALPNI